MGISAMILCDTKYLQLKSTKSKKGTDWVYAHRPNANDVVVILPIIQDKILFLIEERPPLLAEGKGKFSIGLVAGLVGDERAGESLYDAIQAELLEEAGLIADKIDIKTKMVASSAGCVSETFAIAFAYITSYNPVQQAVSDSGIIVDRVLVPIKNVFNWLNEQENRGGVLTSQALAALAYLFKKENL